MKSKVLLPPLLGTESTIAIVPISSTCAEARLKSGLEFLADNEFSTRVYLDPTKCQHSKKALFSCATAKERATALENAFKDEKTGAIIISRGGFGAVEALCEMDFETFKEHPKLVAGFSDVTALLIALYQRCGFAGIHGPMLAGSLARSSENDEARQSAEALLKALKNFDFSFIADYELNELIAGEAVTAPLIGGNLTVLTSLIGTPFEPDFKDHILFLEDTEARQYRIVRNLLQLKLAGKFDGVKGVVLGEFTVPNIARPVWSLEELALDVFEDPCFSFPVYSGLPIGHGDLNLPVPIGVQAKLADNRLIIS